jgi:hypothetical protein
MKRPITACVTLVQLPGGDARVGVTLCSFEEGIDAAQDWSFAIGRLEDADHPLQWLQMALARACDGV